VKPKYLKEKIPFPGWNELLELEPSDPDYQYLHSSTVRGTTEVTYILKSAIPPEPPFVPVEVIRFATRAEAEADPRMPHEWERSGPILKYGEKLYVQVYLGQHEWLIVNVDDPTEMHPDPGWEGTQYGWAFIFGSFKLNWNGEPLDPPERLAGKPITGDALLFSEPEKLRDYLGAGDPHCPPEKSK
jgi:hypothetical protein